MGKTTSISGNDSHLYGNEVTNKSFKLRTGGIVRDVHQVESAGEEALFLNTTLIFSIEKGSDFADESIDSSIIKLFNGRVG
jgi:hypothetical protein